MFCAADARKFYVHSFYSVRVICQFIRIAEFQFRARGFIKFFSVDEL